VAGNLKWVLQPGDPNTARRIAASSGISPIIAQVLVNRGITDLAQAKEFLEPKLESLHDPSLLSGIDRATERIAQAVRRQQKMLVYGDYDVDGMCATAMLLALFDIFHAKADYYLPHRLEEGYGLNAEAIRSIADSGVELMITVDCGVTAVEEAALLRRLGIDLIITDHHEPKHELPEAAAVIDPKIPGDSYPCPNLSGTGVAFKLAWNVAREFSRGPRVDPEFRDFIVDATALVAVATISDVVPLLGENRALTCYGLKALQHTKLPGLRALIGTAGLEGKTVSSQDVAWRIGPRLNAAGRLGEAELSVELLSTGSWEEAQQLAECLEESNRRRQETQRRILASARELLAGEFSPERDLGIVLAQPSWHNGVIGIVAGRLADEYHRPSVVISLDGDIGHGSARSVPEVNLFRVLEECEDTLTSYGGHAQAAGLVIRREELAEFKRCFNEAIRHATGGVPMVPTLKVDAEVPLDKLDRRLVRDIEALAPFGEGNREPVFVAQNVRVAGTPRRVGSDGQHLSFYARQDSASLKAIGFGLGSLADTIGSGRKMCSIAYVPFISTYDDAGSIELRIIDIRSRS